MRIDFRSLRKLESGELNSVNVDKEKYMESRRCIRDPRDFGWEGT